MIESGAEVEAFLSTVPVWVNGEREARRGRKLHVDDIVQVDELELRLTSEDLNNRQPKLRGVRRLGVVRWYKDDKGYGRITADDGEVLVVWALLVAGSLMRVLRTPRESLGELRDPVLSPIWALPAIACGCRPDSGPSRSLGARLPALRCGGCGSSDRPATPSTRRWRSGESVCSSLGSPSARCSRSGAAN